MSVCVCIASSQEHAFAYVEMSEASPLSNDEFMQAIKWSSDAVVKFVGRKTRG